MRSSKHREVQKEEKDKYIKSLVGANESFFRRYDQMYDDMFDEEMKVKELVQLLNKVHNTVLDIECSSYPITEEVFNTIIKYKEYL